MKRVVCLLCILLSALIICTGCVHTNLDEGYSLIRIHIRAESNDARDQAVKLQVRDAVCAYLESELSDVNDFQSAYDGIEKRLKTIEKIADEVLSKAGFGYTSHARLNNEYFPTRSYEGIVVESGYYDALILELGAGKGDNWWCVIYPPLCYLEANGTGGIRYRSKIKEIWDKYFS
ncbi:MAG: stage II sporulation protein R [Clostridia bacterium]|nr:stage II sporulation protein R [Clostridia bacterium]